MSTCMVQDQPWSAQDERQIRGRAHRQPQKKVVKSIHLLAADSSDLVMNDMALRKKDMFEAFVNKELGEGSYSKIRPAVVFLKLSPTELRDLLSGKAVYRQKDLEDLIEDDSEVKGKKRKARKGHPKKDKRGDKDGAVEDLNAERMGETLERMKATSLTTKDTDAPNAEEMGPTLETKDATSEGYPTMKDIDGPGAEKMAEDATSEDDPTIKDIDCPETEKMAQDATSEDDPTMKDIDCPETEMMAEDATSEDDPTMKDIDDPQNNIPEDATSEDDPTMKEGLAFGGVVAGPVFARIAEKAATEQHSSRYTPE